MTYEQATEAVFFLEPAGILYSLAHLPPQGRDGGGQYPEQDQHTVGAQKVLFEYQYLL